MDEDDEAVGKVAEREEDVTDERYYFPFCSGLVREVIHAGRALAGVSRAWVP